MRVVLDTNVLIAAFATQGLCYAVYELCIDQHDIILSEQILKEVADKLDNKLHLPQHIATNIIQYLREVASIEKVKRVTRKVCRDPSDDWILTLAEIAKVDYLITGDPDLLILKRHANIPIIKPRQFWEILRKKQN